MKRGKSLGVLFVFLILILGISFIEIVSAAGFSDNFDSGICNGRWIITPDATTESGKVKITHPGTMDNTQGISSKFTLSGDFDVQVNYSSLSFGACSTSYIYSAIGMGLNGANKWMNIERRYWPNGYATFGVYNNNQIFTDFEQTGNNLAADASTSGIFRIKRVDSTVYFYKSDGVTVLKSADVGTQDVDITLYGRGMCQAIGYFDNFFVNNNSNVIINQNEVCSSFGKECNTWTLCGDVVNCGTCPSGEDCNTNGNCVNSFLAHSCSSADQTIMKLYTPINSLGALWNESSATYGICYRDIFGEDYAGTNYHECNGNNKIINLQQNNNSLASTTQSSTYNTPVCYGNLICRAVIGNTNTNSGLVAYYPFNGNANDMSGYGNNGVPAGGIGFSDNFDSSIDTNKWSQVNSNNPASIENGKLKCVGSIGDSTASASGITSSGKQVLHGDFDIQVDYDASIMPNYVTNLPTAAIIITGSNYYYSLMYFKNYLNLNFIKSLSNQPGWPAAISSPSSSAGKFRIQRTGSTINQYIWSGGSWIPFNTASGDISDMYVTLKVYNQEYNGNEITIPQAYFDNFVVTGSSSMFITDPVRGQVANFSGVNISIPDSSSLKTFPNGLTIGLWIKSSNTNDVPISRWSNSPVGGYGLHSDGNWYMGDRSSWKPILNGRIADNQWHYYNLVWNTTNMISYRDGSVIATSGSFTNPYFLTASNNRMLIGADNRDGNFSFNGSIDEVKIWNRTLTQAEIQYEYDGTGLNDCAADEKTVVRLNKEINPTDNFDSPSLDTNKWYQENPNNPGFIDSGKLKLVGTATEFWSSGSGIGSKYKLHGDFDVQVDYDASIQPSSDCTAATNFRVINYNANTGVYGYSYDFNIFKNESGNYETVASTSQIEGSTWDGLVFYRWSNGVPYTSLPSGKFRIKRVENTMHGYQWENNNWLEIATISNCDTGDMIVTLGVNNFKGQSQIDQYHLTPEIPQAYFDNLIATSSIIYDETNSRISNASDNGFPVKICCRKGAFGNASWENMNGIQITGANISDSVNLVVRGEIGNRIINYTIKKQGYLSWNPLNWFSRRVAQTSARGYAVWKTTEPGKFYFIAQIFSGNSMLKEINSFNELNGILTVSGTHNSMPLTQIIKPVNETNYIIDNLAVSTGPISFEQISSDEDDDLRAEWNFADGNITIINNCLTNKSCNIPHSYHSSGTKIISLTMNEMTRTQRARDFTRIYIYKTGLNIFSIIDKPDYKNPPNGTEAVTIDGNSSHVANCSIGSTECDNTAAAVGKSSCYIVNDTITPSKSFYCYKHALSNQLNFTWTIDPGTSDAETVESDNRPFTKQFYNAGDHVIKLKIRYIW